MQTTPQLDTALSQGRVEFFIAIRIDANSGGTARLLDGGGEVTIVGDGTYVGADPNWGTLESIDNIGDGTDEQAPALVMTLLPNETSDVAAITSPSQQGSRTRIWLGALDVNARTVVPDPYLLFDGVIDVPVLSFSEGSRQVAFDVVSNFERLFLDDEGSRLSPAAHKSIWPGETGLDDVTGIVRQVLWGPGDPITGSAPGSVGVGSGASVGGVGFGPGAGSARGGLGSAGLVKMV